MKFDIVIVGGSFVGLSLALALSQETHSIAVIEKNAKTHFTDHAHDDRAIALSAGSQQFFHNHALWPLLQADALPLNFIHVSEQGRFGAVRFDAAQENVEALGYVVNAGQLLKTLYRHVSALPNVQFFHQSRVTDIQLNENKPTITLSDQQPLQARCIAAADGTHSAICDLANIASKHWGEGYQSLVANIIVSRPNGMAYERFVQNGAIAMIPKQEGYKCIGTLPAQTIKTLLAMNETEFLSYLQKIYGYRLGKFEQAACRQAFPLQIMQRKEIIKPGLAVLGNAAHTIYPLAAQGLNLGLRDVEKLSEVVNNAYAAKENIGSVAVLQRYAKARSTDHQRMIAFTDKLLKTFSSRHLPVKLGRKLGLLALEGLPPAKQELTRRLMGFV